MKIGKTFYATDRKTWRSWLVKNHQKENEIWLIYYKKVSGKPRIPYNDAVEEALSFGWIDSIVKNIDDERFAQRFSPRKPNSQLSQMNRERIRRLIAQKRMTPAGLAAIAHTFKADSDNEDFTISDDILGAIKENTDAWVHFQRFPESYKRIRIAYIESQRRHGAEAFERSLRNFIRMTARGKRFGFVRE
ncbi:MAG: YdeI/OmpD-associated family protein [Candidatus Micrarchaeota archaeon]|nr:YdeI/OmpD-associated family protein [Candidatus Micrarchaeota archaeon]